MAVITAQGITITGVGKYFIANSLIFFNEFAICTASYSKKVIDIYYSYHSYHIVRHVYSYHRHIDIASILSMVRV